MDIYEYIDDDFNATGQGELRCALGWVEDELVQLPDTYASLRSIRELLRRELREAAARHPSGGQRDRTDTRPGRADG